MSTDPGGIVTLTGSTFNGSRADRATGGVIYGNEYSAVNIIGDRNQFMRNSCEGDGGVLAASKNTRVIVEGGNFTENSAKAVGRGTAGRQWM